LSIVCCEYEQHLLPCMALSRANCRHQDVRLLFVIEMGFWGESFVDEMHL
jgi:hypothetical protein